MGRGKGYYDAYIACCLARPAPPPYLLAVAFSTQCVDDIPTSPNDKPMDEVIFP